MRPDVSIRILVISRAARFEALKILMKGMSSGTMSGASRTSLCGDIASTSETRRYGRLAFRVFYGGYHEDDVSTIAKVRHERFGQHEGPKVIRGVRHLPAPSILRGPQLHNACVVDETCNGKIQEYDLSSRALNA